MYCTLTATHLTLIYDCTYIRLSEFPYNLIFVGIKPVTSGLISVNKPSALHPEPFRHEMYPIAVSKYLK